MLSDQHWLEVIRRAPLVSIDLVIRDRQDRVLLGLRTNRPARGDWFVPGGVIRKDKACTRRSRASRERNWPRCSVRLLGVYEHFCGDNFAGRDGVSTHYVVLAHDINPAVLAGRRSQGATPRPEGIRHRRAAGPPRRP